LLVNSLAEEEAFDGADDEEDGDGGEDEYDDEDKEDDEDDDYENVEIGRLPAHAAARRGRGRAAPPARHSLQRPAAPAAAEVDCLVADFAQAGLDSPSFNFQARYPHVLIPTPALASGRRTVVWVLADPYCGPGQVLCGGICRWDALCLQYAYPQAVCQLKRTCFS
jgi:hypothetical protein